MRDLVISLFGTYSPIVPTDSAITADFSGFAYADWPWLFGVIIFSICLISLFKILGVFFNNK